MNEMSKNENIDIQIYNFAYLDENTKRMIRRALLKYLFPQEKCQCHMVGVLVEFR